MERYWVWEYGLFENNPKRVDSLNPEITLEVVKLADAQATIAALQVDPYKQGFIDALEKVASDWASKEFRGHDEIQSVEVQAFLDTRHVHYEECRGMKPLQSQLTQCTAKMEALQRERDEAITAHRNIVKQFDELTCFIGCDYDPETETWVSGKPPYLSAGTNEVEACKAAVDALRAVAIVLQAALDAEREKVKDGETAYGKLSEKWNVTDLELTQLKALVRALPVVRIEFDGAYHEALLAQPEDEAVKKLLKYRATLDATTPAHEQTKATVFNEWGGALRQMADVEPKGGDGE